MNVKAPFSPNFITLTSSNTTPSGFVELNPAFAVTLDRLAPQYPRILGSYTLTQLNHTTPASCNPEEWYEQYREMNALFRDGDLIPRPTIVLAGVCSPSIPIIGDFARELDFLMITCQSEDGKVENRPRFPTVISMAGGNNQFYGDAVVAVVERLHWKTAAVINDANSAIPGIAKSRENCRGAIEAFGRKKGSIDVLVVPTDFAQESAHRALKEASNFTRSLHPHIRHGDTVDSRLTWRMNDSLDQKVARAMLSTIIVGSPQVNWTKIAASLRQFRIINLPSLAKNFLACSGEAAEAAVMILNESCMTAGEECTSGKFLPTDVGKNFSLTSRIVSWYRTPKNKFFWLMHGERPPPDRPLCGLHGELCLDGNIRITVTILVPVLAAIILAVIAFIMLRGTSVPANWWIIAEVNLLHARVK
ncbi:hypothetical protein BV898_12848 [Hypsibius exemplaris]|uniref:Receptor ligand binding region domain-containing protein n=1 Tax=Hypsibius exemplaris TaxID=2072580 RepID=A0A1W0WCN7_HYPEX|nr:hypothetical protein BV898_12848 [Hypsibius exemplaris]